MNDFEFNSMKQRYDQLSARDKERFSSEVVRRAVALWARERGLPATPPPAPTVRKFARPAAPVRSAPLSDADIRKLLEHPHRLKRLSPAEQEEVGAWIRKNYAPGAPAMIARQVMMKVARELPARVGIVAAMLAARLKATCARPIVATGATELLNHGTKRPPVRCEPSPPLRRRTY
jgi:hypothetical protein